MLRRLRFCIDMERYETRSICRLCLSESNNLFYVFEQNGVHGWTAADRITELLGIQVSVNDIYPRCVCVECMGKLEDFKKFKDRCESSKELLDRAHAVKRGIGRNAESIGETLNCEGNHSGLQLKEEDLNTPLEKDPLDLTENEKPIKSETEDIVICNEMPPNVAIESSNDPCIPGKNEGEDPVMTLETDTRHLPSSLSLSALDCIETISMESNLSPPCIMVEDSLIASEGEMELQEEEDRDPLGDLTDVKLSVSELNGAFTEVKEEEVESYLSPPYTIIGDSLFPSEDEMELHSEKERDPLGDLSDMKPSVSELNGAFSGVKELCGEGSNHEFAGDSVTSSRLQGSVDISEVKVECCSPSGGHDLDVSTAELRSTDKGNNDPLDMTSLTFTLKREECEVRLSATSSHNKPTESAQKNVTEQDIASYVQSDVGERANRTSDLRALRPWTHVSRKEVNDTGGNAENVRQVEMEMQTGGALQDKLEGTDNAFKCNSCGVCFAAESNLRNHIESHFGEQMSKYEVYSGEELIGRDSLVCANVNIDGKGVVNLKCINLCKAWTCIVCQKVFKGDGHLRLRAGETTFKCDECGTGIKVRKNQTPPTIIHSGDTYKCEECGKGFTGRNSLNRHLRIHTGERPVKCNIRHQGFSRSSDLILHSKIHTSDNAYKCNEYGIGFIENSYGTGDLRHHTGERPFKCHICNKQFKRRWILADHSKIHSGDTYNCEQCGKVFTRRSRLNRHLTVHTGERPFKCEICHKLFTQRSHLVYHSKIHSSDQPYKCNECGKEFIEIARLKRHLLIHTGERPFTCDICNKGFTREKYLRGHSKIHSGDTYNCEQCGKGFTRKSNLKVHIHFHTGESPFKCDICDKRFNQRRYLRVHSKIHSIDNQYKCNECGIGFIEIAMLKRHLRIHTVETQFKCVICNKEFNEKRYLAAHSKIHSGDTYNCEQCGKRFTRKSNLKVHLLSHTGESPFKCEICHKRFNQRRYLLLHSKIHSSDNPYQCNECGIGFIEITRLKRHLRIHTVGRPFKCGLCNKEFTRKSILTAHYKYHRGDTYNCEQCGKGFATKGNLNRHLKIHTGAGQFKCDLCDKQFNQRRYLHVHSKIHSTDKP